MHPMMTHRHPLAAANPMRSMPTFIPAHRIFGWTPLQLARSHLDQAERCLPIARTTLQLANAELGHANSYWQREQRRRLQAAAMGTINRARAAMRHACRKLAERRAEVERLEQQPELQFPPPTVRQPARASWPLHQPRGSFPAGTVVTTEQGPNGGWYVSIVRPGKGGGIATHVPKLEDTRGWIDAQLAAPVLN